LGSYGSAKRKVMPTVEHLSHKGLNNRSENSHLPLRKRERAMQKFKSPGQLQRFLATFSGLRNLFVPSHHQRSAINIYLHRINAFSQWKQAAMLDA
ncbi:DDE-type integrase/transposase/recombinase, partial [Pseudovibrio axinellae]|uniref:DDE-type integrase/transposase/recombinase n=1 Tax=Pseudovibrio axinellae TaxID=989403 RepID=UPI0011134368